MENDTDSPGMSREGESFTGSRGASASPTSDRHTNVTIRVNDDQTSGRPSVFSFLLIAPSSQTVLKIKTVGKRHARLKVVQRELADLVVVQPVVLERLYVVLPRLLLAVQGQRQAADVRLADDETPARLVVGQLRQVERLRGAGYQVLLHVEVTHRHHHVLLQADLFLTGGNLDHIQVVPGHVVLALSHAPVYQRNGNRERHQVLLQQVPVRRTEVVGHLVETHAGIEAGIEARLLPRAIHLTLRLQHILALFQVRRVVLPRQHHGPVGRHVNIPRTRRKLQLDVRVAVQVQEGGQGRHRTLARDLRILQRVARVHLVQLQRQQVGL